MMASVATWHVTRSIWSQVRTPGSPSPSHTWLAHHSWDDAWLIHPLPVACAYQLECKLRLPSNTQWPPSVYKILCNNIMLTEAKEKSRGDKHIMILCNILCMLCSLMNLINCLTGEHDWHCLDSGKLKRQKPLTVQHVITNSCVV